MKAISFGCPNCRIEALISHCAVNSKKEVILIGTCAKCSETLKFRLEVVMAELLDCNLSEGNGRVH